MCVCRVFCISVGSKQIYTLLFFIYRWFCLLPIRTVLGTWDCSHSLKFMKMHFYDIEKVQTHTHRERECGWWSLRSFEAISCYKSFFRCCCCWCTLWKRAKCRQRKRNLKLKKEKKEKTARTSTDYKLHMKQLKNSKQLQNITRASGT